MNKNNKTEATSWLHKILTGLGLSSGISQLIATAIIAAVAAVVTLLSSSCGSIEPWHIDVASDVVHHIFIDEGGAK